METTPWNLNLKVVDERFRLIAGKTRQILPALSTFFAARHQTLSLIWVVIENIVWKSRSRYNFSRERRKKKNNRNCQKQTFLESEKKRNRNGKFEWLKLIWWINGISEKWFQLSRSNFFLEKRFSISFVICQTIGTFHVWSEIS